MKSGPDDGLNYPVLSVVIYARDNAEELRGLIPVLLQQVYPADFDIIVVNDGENEEVKDVYNFFANQHRNIYHTFVPDQAKSVSRRKLAITLGVKASRHNHIIFTDADSKPDSTEWLRLMARPFAEGKEITLGTTHYNQDKFRKQCSPSGRLSFITTSIAWINSALEFKPYRGDIRNIGFTKNLFMSNNGFARNLNLQGGTDDIFISEIADSDNCDVVTAADASVEIAGGINSSRHWKHLRMSHYFTSARLRKNSRIAVMSGPVALWIETAGIAAAIWLSPLSVIADSLSAIILITTWIVLSGTFRKIAIRFKTRIPYICIPVLLLWYPFDEIIWHIRARLNRSREYTWS